MDPQDQNGLNLEQSGKLADKPVYKEYKDWLKANGVVVDPAILYPAYFGNAKNGVVGVAATKVIPANQAIIAVPYNLIITVDKVKQDDDLFHIMHDNPNMFKYGDQAAFSVLTLYMCRQLIKGKASFYAPYFAIAESGSNWTHWDMLAVENLALTKLMKEREEEMEEHFMAFLSVFRRYPKVFSQEMTNAQYKQIFEKSYTFICTRAFGWSLPSISLIPMADSLNHHNEYVTHMLIDVNLQKQPHEMYSIKGKKYNLSLLSQLYPQLPKTQPPPRKKHRTDKFVAKHKEILAEGTKKDSQAYILWQQYKAGVRNFRQLHFYEESCQQDNDTDDETIEKLQFSLEQFRFYEKYETAGINDKNKGQELAKYWKIFVDPVFDEQESSEEEKEKKIQSTKNVEEVKQKFAAQSKDSEGSSLVSSSSSSDSDDEQFKWMAGNPESHNHKTTYFIMASRKPIKKNEQIYNFYGRRSNRFLLLGYNFILDENKYDSFAFRINIDNWKSGNKPFETKIPVSKLINKDVKTNVYFTREIRIKKQKICIELINHCRALLIGWTDLKTEANKKVRITIPFSIEFEKKVLGLAEEILKSFQKQYMTSLQEDEQLLEKAQKHEQRMAIKMRINYKETLVAQLELIQQCQQALKAWKNGKININNEKEMRDLGKIRHYLCSLQRSKI